MVTLEVIRDYLIDDEQGLKLLLIRFLNLVMQAEGLDQAGEPNTMRRLICGKDTGTGTRNDLSRRELGS